ncbi:MAG: hypothetical protein LRY54_00430 [Alphaproteobacteria bacterium]|nr:hypothetical protein [Alphaproteobacteria bacterium]
MSLVKDFTAKKGMVYDNDPPTLCLESVSIPGEPELDVPLGLLGLTDDEIDALVQAKKVKGTYREKSDDEICQEIKISVHVSRIEILSIEPDL